MSLHGIPDNLEIDVAVVVVDDAVAHTGDLAERDVRKFGASLGREPGSGFTCDEEAPEYGILRVGVGQELFARRFGDVAVDIEDKRPA